MEMNEMRTLVAVFVILSGIGFFFFEGLWPVGVLLIAVGVKLNALNWR